MGGRGGGSPGAKGGGQANAAPARASVATNKAEQQVENMYYDLSRGPNDWVTLADLRDALPGITREKLDKTLIDMGERGGAFHLETWDNRKARTQRDKDASFHFGGTHADVIRIDNPDIGI